jgi:cation:H+ antiporter
LTVGAKCLVDGAVTIARLLGMSELLIGLTIVAAGTSLPEVAASILATIRGERDIAVGNVVGSNIFNILCVLGLSSAVVPGGVDVSETALKLDIPVMIAVAVACLPIFFTGHLIARWEGGLFLGYYLAYTGYLVARAMFPEYSRTFERVMLTFVIPLTVITLTIGAIRSLRTPNPPS